MAANGATAPSPDAHWKATADAYKELASGFGVTTSSSVVPGATVPVMGMAPGTKKSAGGLTVQSMRMSNFVRDQRVTTKATPYADLIVRTGEDQDVSFMVGEFDRTWERLREAGDRGVEWFIEVIVGLSLQKCNRSVRIVLSCPESVMPDRHSFLMSSHLEAMAEKRKHAARQMDAWQFFFAEEDARFNDVHISKGKVDRNIHPAGLLRLLEDISTLAGKGYQVTGNPVIRVQLDSAAGVVLRASHLKQPFFRDVLMGWLLDMIAFTSGTDGRLRVWNAQQHRYEPIPMGDPRRRQRETVDQVFGGHS